MDSPLQAAATLRKNEWGTETHDYWSRRSFGGICGSRKGLRSRGLGSFRKSVPTQSLPVELASESMGLASCHSSAATKMMPQLKLLEYAAFSIPAISARLKASNAIFDSDSLEHFKRAGRVGLARAIERLFLDPKRRASMIARAGQVALRPRWDEQRAGLFGPIDSISGPGSSDEIPFTETIGCERRSRTVPQP